MVANLTLKDLSMEGNLFKRGLWTVEEDKILIDYVGVHGKGRWSRIAKKTDLKRNGKSCRLRWMNYLCPSINRGSFSDEEEDLIIRLHSLLGNRWSLIASRIPGRTDNQVKNHWNTHLRKKLEIVKTKTKSSEGNSSVEHTQQGEGKGENQGINCSLQAINTVESNSQVQLMSPEYHLSPLWLSNDDLFSIESYLNGAYELGWTPS